MHHSEPLNDIKKTKRVEAQDEEENKEKNMGAETEEEPDKWRVDGVECRESTFSGQKSFSVVSWMQWDCGAVFQLRSSTKMSSDGPFYPLWTVEGFLRNSYATQLGPSCWFRLQLLCVFAAFLRTPAIFWTSWGAFFLHWTWLVKFKEQCSLRNV